VLVVTTARSGLRVEGGVPASKAKAGSAAKQDRAARAAADRSGRIVDLLDTGLATLAEAAITLRRLG